MFVKRVCAKFISNTIDHSNGNRRSNEIESNSTKKLHESICVLMSDLRRLVMIGGTIALSLQASASGPTFKTLFENFSAINAPGKKQTPDTLQIIVHTS